MSKYKLEEICLMQSGGTPKRSNPGFYNGHIPWVTISDFKNSVNDVIYETEESITQEGIEAIGNRLFKKGTLLLAMYGSIGKTAITGADMSTNQAILGITPRDPEQLNISFLKYWLDYYKPIIQSQGQGATLNNISLTIVKRQEIDLPDLDTQNKIVAILDKAKGLVQKREETIAKYDELLRATFLEMFGDPVTNDKGWKKNRLDEMGIWKSGGTPSRSKPEYFKGDIPWYTSGELNQIYISSASEYISKEAVRNSNAKIIESGSLLIGMYDTAAMKSSITMIEGTCNQAIAYSKIDENYCLTEYLYFAIQIGKEYFKSSQRGVRQQNLNLSMIKSIEIPTPSIEIQAEFVSKFRKVESIKKKLLMGCNQLIALRDALSQLAFKGELNFNTAVDLEVLLENDYDFFKTHSTAQSIQLLLERLDKNELNDKKIYEEEVYNKAKSFVFGLLQEGLIKQAFDAGTKTLKLALA